jgi:Domain of unknown function (DUF1707)
MADPRIRASDDDRDKAATLLREHHAAGRLTPEEFNERLDQAFAAKTIGDLDELLSDLPAIDLYKLPDSGLPRRGIPGSSSHLAAVAAAGGVAGQHGRLSPAWQAAWGSWFTVSALLAVVWVLGGMSSSLWFLWIAGPWGIVLLGRWISGSHPGDHGHPGSHGHGHDHHHGHDRHDRGDHYDELPGDENQIGGPR